MKQLRYLLKREFHLFFTNKTMLSVFFMAPIFYALLLGFTYEKGKVTDIPVIVDDVPLILTPFAFIRRFTFEEELAARNLAKTDEIVDALLDSLKIVENVDLQDDRVTGGLRHLVTSGVLTEERVYTILNDPIQDWEK